MYDWLVFLHVLGTFGFLLAHGASAMVSFQLRRERNRERICALLDLSSSSYGLLYSSLGLLLLSGIITGFLGRWWRWIWIWAALGLLIAIVLLMYALGSSYYTQVRKAVGMPYFFMTCMKGLRMGSVEKPFRWASTRRFLQSRMSILWISGFPSLSSMRLSVWRQKA